MTVFFGFTLVESMVPDDAIMHKQVLTQDQAIEVLKEGVRPCLSHSQKGLGDLASRLGIDIPPTATFTNMEELSIGDNFLVISNQNEYTEDVANAKFTLWTRLA